MQAPPRGRPGAPAVPGLRWRGLGALGVLLGLFVLLATVQDRTWTLVAAGAGAALVLLFGVLVFEPALRRLRRAQDGARESDSAMRAILDAASEGILSLDRDGVIQSINPAAERMFGYLPHEAVGFGVHLLIDELEIGRERNSGARTGTRAATGRRSDGTEFPVEIGLSSTHVDGADLHVLTVQDGSVQARAEKAIRESEEREAAILSTARDSIVRLDAEGRITEFNAAAERTFGWERRQVLGKEFADVLIPHPNRMAIRRGLRDAAQSNDGALLGKRHRLAARCKDGHEVQVDLALTTVDLSSGRQFTALLSDVTEPEADRARAATPEEMARARAILDAVHWTVLTLDEHGRVEWINPAGERLFGWSARELAGADVVRLLPADQVAARTALLEESRAAASEGRGACAKIVGLCRDGTRIPLHVSASHGTSDGRTFTTWIARELDLEQGRGTNGAR